MHGRCMRRSSGRGADRVPEAAEAAAEEEELLLGCI